MSFSLKLLYSIHLRNLRRKTFNVRIDANMQQFQLVEMVGTSIHQNLNALNMFHKYFEVFFVDEITCKRFVDLTTKRSYRFFSVFNFSRVS